MWSQEEARAALTPAEWRVFARRFGFDEAPNFEGAWHAHVFHSLDEIAKEIAARAGRGRKSCVDAARAKLLAIRGKRVWPGLDDKILTSWNALAIRGLALAARHLERPESRGRRGPRARLRARQIVASDGRLLATAKGGVAHLNAYLDDYAYLANALLEMLQVRWRNADAAWLREMLDAMLAHFEDPSSADSSSRPTITRH